jgi:predicted metalloprotease
MRWSDDGGGLGPDIEDRRGEGGGGFNFGGGGLKLGCGGLILLGILSLVFKTNFFALLSPQAGTPPQAADARLDTRPVAPPSAEEDQRARFVKFVVTDVQKTWDQTFPGLGRNYTHATLVLYRDATRSGCGFAQAQMGPFYCPEDRRVYLDMGFFDELSQRFGAPGDFAQAYVIAHEFGHHVQTLLGIEGRVRRAMEESPERQNELSVRLELQADCLAGVWGHGTAERNILETGDVEKGLAAAAAVGDDRLQRAAGQRVNPESWTHGSARQRTDWFTRGLREGTVGACDTFQVAR